MVEPPKLTRRPTPEQVYRRRVTALVLLALLTAVAVWIAWMTLRTHKTSAPPPTTTVAPPKVVKVLFPEGFTRAEMAQRAAVSSRAISARAYLAASASSPLPGRFAGDGKPRSLEGFLFPATYEIYETDKAQRLVDKQVEAFRLSWGKVNLTYARSKNLTSYDVLIIASMIEKEAVVESERPLIAAVIYNRLRARMPLGIDATLRYGLGIPGTESITRQDLASDSPFNTRKFPGLPPTPIANPGLKSIQAAAHPATANYLYFVAKPDKRHHFFTASFDEFNRYKAAHGYQ
ncbi:MAG TPA: endolytic transglycosylase MltG [Gaiellaceae bacterium]|nr:endolytic transglycosylase MltG [Gaiellaceae bacterium]